MTFLSRGFCFEDLYLPEKLEQLDQDFLTYLEESDEALALRLKRARQILPSSLEESALLLDLSPYVEDYLAVLFSIEREVESLQSQTHGLAPLYRCKRLFIQRQAAKAYSKGEALTFNGLQLKEAVSAYLGGSYTDLAFARCVLKALENEAENKPLLAVATKYAAWSLYQENSSVIFKLPRKIDPESLIPLRRMGSSLTSPHLLRREGFDCISPSITPEEALDQAHYCIVCHPQGKDSCSKGYSQSN